MTMQDIGKALGKSRKSVSYLINKAIVKLRRIPGIEEYAIN
jgi:DNA-directed RNA polymerase specialized sigma subunit